MIQLLVADKPTYKVAEKICRLYIAYMLVLLTL